jgi:hypothetical protein
MASLAKKFEEEQARKKAEADAAKNAELEEFKARRAADRAAKKEREEKEAEVSTTVILGGGQRGAGECTTLRLDDAIRPHSHFLCFFRPFLHDSQTSSPSTLITPSGYSYYIICVNPLTEHLPFAQNIPISPNQR